MERKARKALAAAVAVTFVLVGTSSGANALSIGNLSWHPGSSHGQVKKHDLSVSVIKLKELIEEKRQERREAVLELLTKLRDRIHHVEIDDRDGGGSAAPEPSAALVFGLGLLVASRFHRRKR